MEKEREAVEYNKVTDIETDNKLREINRDLDALSASSRPDYERFQRFKIWLFMRYCNKNKLIEEHIEELSHEDDLKREVNARESGAVHGMRKEN